MKRIILLLLVLCYGMGLAQLAPFTVTATKLSDETCPSNGALSWSTSGLTAGSTVTYTVVRPSDNSTVQILSGTSYAGIPAGSYKIIATQTLGTNSNQSTSNVVTVADQKVPLAYTISLQSSEICGNDGSFTVNVSSGRAPYTYQLLDSSQTVIRSQPGNTFTGLAAGTYNVRVVDQCGAGVAKTVTIANTPSNFTINAPGLNTPMRMDANCKVEAYTSLRITAPNTVKLPLTVVVSYNDAGGNPVSYTTTVTGASSSSCLNGVCEYTFSPAIKLPLDPSQTSIPAVISVTDGCGQTKTLNYTFNLALSAGIVTNPAACGGSFATINFYNIQPYKYTVTFVSAPAGFDPAAYNANHGTMQSYHQYGSATQPLPAGNYTMQIADSCGRTTTKSFTIAKQNPSMNFYTGLSCPAGNKIQGTILNGFSLSSATITSAPASFGNALPYSIPQTSLYKNNVSSTGYQGFILNNLPSGSYTVTYKTTCDDTVYTTNFTIQNTSAVNNPTASVTVGCNAATINYTFNSYPSLQQYFGVQKYYPATGHWANVVSDVSNYTNEFANNSQLEYFYGSTKTSSAQLSNLGSGQYRVIQYFIYQDISATDNTLYYANCYKVVTTFTIGNEITYSNAYAFQCADGTYDVAVSASKGSEALQYSIVTDGTNTATTIVNNGNNPIFHGLSAGTYFIRVTDVCGNFITRKVTLDALGQPGIRFVPDCAAGTLKLMVDGLTGLGYEWYKSTDPATILSTSNILDLGVYDASKAGIYKVRIYSTNATYCINSTQTMQITVPSLTSANPGVGQTATITHNGITPSVDLFSYLTGPYDTYGNWTQLSGPSVSLLTGSSWNVLAAAAGTYTFRYTVTPLCAGSAQYADVTLRLDKLCYKLPVMASAGNPALPTTTGITILPRPNQNTANWPAVRNGGWLAVEANSAGIVLNRVAFDAGGNPVGIPAANFVSGMAVYDTTNKCLKIYDGTKWSCYTTQTCPE